MTDIANAPAGSDAEKLARFEEAKRVAQENLIKFDTLDFEFYSHQKWDRFAESHHENITVHNADGSIIVGLHDHIEDIKRQFVFAPNSKVSDHLIRIGDGIWTSVISTFEGTFSEPMPTPDGNHIPPTGKPFKLHVCTVGHWVDGKMDEEWLFYDTGNFMKQIGLES